MIPAAMAGSEEAPERNQKGPDPKMMKEIREYKIKFLAQEMELKSDQRDKFAELYAEYDKMKAENFHQMRRLEKSLKREASDADYKNVTDRIAECRDNDNRIDKEFDAKFAEFLSAKQLYLLHKAEAKFRKKMMEMHSNKKHKNQKRKD